MHVSANEKKPVFPNKMFGGADTGRLLCSSLLDTPTKRKFIVVSEDSLYVVAGDVRKRFFVGRVCLQRCLVDSMLLAKSLRALERVAPLRLAAPWDNVGLLVDVVTAAAPERAPFRVLLTIDLTPAVLEEAIRLRSHLIVAYHPTPFAAMKRFESGSHASRVVLMCAAHGIAVYSPHTAADCVAGGVNDWLVRAVTERLKATPTGSPAAAAAADNSAADAAWTVSPVTPCADPVLAASGAGEGRIARRNPASGNTHAPAPLTLALFVDAVKAALHLDHVTLALPERCASEQRGDNVGAALPARLAAMHAAASIPVSSFAVCAGSGGSILAGVPVDVLLTGEMGHHAVLAEVRQGRAVVLTGHTNCERGALPVLAARLREEWAAEGGSTSGGGGDGAADDGLDIHISRVDADPLVVV